MVRLKELFEIEEVKPKPIEKPVSKSIMRPKLEIKPKVKRERIVGDKNMNKEEIINWISEFIKKNEKQYTLDFLRGQKLIYKTINEMRK